MAYTTIPKSTAFFNTKLYSGNGGTQTITGVSFQPDWTWIKNRNAGEHHVLTDVVRGANKQLRTNANTAQGTLTTQLTGFTSDGFSVGAGSEVNNGSQTYASWNWKAGTTSGIATDATTTITPSSYSFNQTSGFSIIRYTGNGVDGAYLPHGLGASPKVMIVKRLVDAGWDWYVYHVSLGNQKYLQLNTTNAISSTDGMWGSYTPTTVNMKMSNDNQIGASGKDYIMYCFAEKQGYSKFGSYVGNGSADGTFVYTGFKPSFLMIKKSSSAGNNWFIFNNKTAGYNPDNDYLSPNTVSAEGSTVYLDIVSNGFKLRASESDVNTSGTYIYMAFAEEPLVSTNGVPATAR